MGASTVELVLDRPLVLLVGPNGSGKTTLTTALRWALFGEADEDKPVGARGHEAKRAVIHRAAEEAHARVELRDGEGRRLEVARRRRRADPGEDELRAHLEEEALELEEGEEALAGLLGTDLELYPRAIAPPQASLRELVRDVSKERDAAARSPLRPGAFGAGPLRGAADLPARAGRGPGCGRQGAGGAASARRRRAGFGIGITSSRRPAASRQ